jgi:hypothetical protein
MRNHQPAGIIEVLPQVTHQLVNLRFASQPFCNNSIPDVVDKIPEDSSPVMPVGVYVDNWVDLEVDDPGGTEHPVSLSADIQVDSAGVRIGFVDLKQPLPGRRGRIAHMCQIVCFVARNQASRPHQRNHLLNGLFWFRHIDQNETRVDQVKPVALASACRTVTLASCRSLTN